MTKAEQHRLIRWARTFLSGKDLDNFVESLVKHDEIAEINHLAILSKYNTNI